MDRVYNVQYVPLATESGWLADRCSMSQQLVALQTHTTDTFLFISHTTNVLLFKFRCNILIGVRIIKEMPGSVASGTLCTSPNEINPVCYQVNNCTPFPFTASSKPHVKSVQFGTQLLKKLRKATVSSCLSICLSTWNKSAHTEWIFLQT